MLICVRFCPGAAAQFVFKKVKKAKNIKITPVRDAQLARAWRISAGSRSTAQRQLTRNITRATGRRKRSHEAAHHIVAYSARHARFAQDVLRRCGVHPNEAANGVFVSGTIHGRLDGRAYYENINRLMQEYALDCGFPGPFGRPPIRDALAQIGQEIAKGRFPH